MDSRAKGLRAFLVFMGIAEAVNWTVFGLCCYIFHYKQITGISEMETMLSVGVALHIAATAICYTAFAERFTVNEKGAAISTAVHILVWMIAGIPLSFSMFALLIIIIPRLQGYGNEYDGIQYLIFGLMFHVGTAAAMIVLRTGRYLFKDRLMRK